MAHGTRGEQMDRSIGPDWKTGPTGPDRTYFGPVLGPRFWTNSVFGPVDLVRPLDHKFFVKFCFPTTTNPSPSELFHRYVFAFVSFGSLIDCYGNKTYLTGVLRE
uniref:Replication protein A 70 kDa DNA-binding subunit B n=1 Tax=Tanacetum cinerariifolium TaxID=118510 RepID=A0A699H4Q3_TANCI|nr:replication protein A 70 kDa DNA-binding subunit B [Tanacetum cinerariifolium]